MTQANPLAALAPDIPDLTRLPVRMQLGATPLFGALLMLGGGVFPVVIFLILTLIGWVAEVPPAWFWIKLIFVAIPLLAVPWGWWILKSRTEIEISAETVRWSRSTPLGRRSWETPLAEFEGVQLAEIWPSSTSQDRVPRYAAQLVHPNPDRSPHLTHTKDEGLARQVQQRIADLTGLPVLES